MAQFGVEWKKQAVPGSIGELVHHVANKTGAARLRDVDGVFARARQRPAKAIY